VSSLIEASESLGDETLNGDCDSRIIHFDATQRRKEKMRQMSQDLPQAAEPTPQPAAIPQPAPVRPAVQSKPIASAVPERAAVKPAANGTATLGGYTTPAVSPAVAPAASLSKLSEADLERFLIDFVVEQTGYPPEMVELDADLEADLGIDSIKKAQLFGELAERFAITMDVTDESLSLDDFPTLAHVMRFLQSQSPGTPAVPAPVVPANGSVASVSTKTGNPHANGNGAMHATKPTAAPPTPVSQTLANAELESFLIEFVVEQTGYPPEMVELDADLEADLGIDSIKKAQLFGELAEQFAISVDVTDENLSLDDFPTLRHVMEFLQTSGSKAPAVPSANGTVPAVEPVVRTDAAPIASAPSINSLNGIHRANEPEPEQVSSTLGQEELEAFLVNFVVEQTGYPPEMVEMDADLEADLGIDSIKKAQMMGELAEQFAISVDVTDENLSLDDFPTLRHVCNFLAAPGKAVV
jgi:acyl carrier protein